MKVRVSIVYHMNSCVQYEVSTRPLLHLTSVCLYLIAFKPHVLTKVTISSLLSSQIVITRIFQGLVDLYWLVWQRLRICGLVRVNMRSMDRVYCIVDHCDMFEECIMYSLSNA